MRNKHEKPKGRGSFYTDTWLNTRQIYDPNMVTTWIMILKGVEKVLQLIIAMMMMKMIIRIAKYPHNRKGRKLYQVLVKGRERKKRANGVDLRVKSYSNE